MIAKKRTVKKILLYYVPNDHSVAIETLCSEINKTGSKLIVLTQSPKGDFHSYLDKLGVMSQYSDLKQEGRT